VLGRLLLVAAIAAVGAALVPELALGDFKQPGGGVYCGPNRTTPVGLLCWRSSTGLTVVMNETGKVTVDTVRKNRHMYEDSAPPLRFGHTWRFRDAFRCTMEKKGLTCRNRSKHGWFLGRTEGYKIF
jgi:hypothetical protein